MEGNAYDDGDAERLTSPASLDLADGLNISSVFPIPKSRRKSRLTCGRKEHKNSVNPVAPHLHKTIPKTLPDDERLSQLLEDAFEVCMSTVERELRTDGADDKISDLVSRQSQCLERVREYLGKSNVCKLIVTDDEKWKDDSSFTVFYSFMDRLKSESEKWDELFLKTRKDFQTLLNSPPEQDDDFAEIAQEIEQYDYRDVLSEADQLAEQFIVQANYLVQVIKMVDYCESVFPRHIKYLNDSVCKRVFCETAETPRSLLEKNILCHLNIRPTV